MRRSSSWNLGEERGEKVLFPELLRDEGGDAGGTLAVEEGRGVLGGVLRVREKREADETHRLVVLGPVADHDHLLHVGLMGVCFEETGSEGWRDGEPCVLYACVTDLRSEGVHQCC